MKKFDKIERPFKTLADACCDMAVALVWPEFLAARQLKALKNVESQLIEKPAHNVMELITTGIRTHRLLRVALLHCRDELLACAECAMRMQADCNVETTDIESAMKRLLKRIRKMSKNLCFFGEEFLYLANELSEISNHYDYHADPNEIFSTVKSTQHEIDDQISHAEIAFKMWRFSNAKNNGK